MREKIMKKHTLVNERSNLVGKPRNSSIELLRIIAMICIVAHHSIVNSGIITEITPENVMSRNAIFALLFGWGGRRQLIVLCLLQGILCARQIYHQRNF